MSRPTLLPEDAMKLDLTDPFRTAPRPLAALPRVVRLVIGNALVGFAVAAFFVALVLATDLGGLSALIAGTEGGALALGLFWVLNGLLFAGAQIAIVVWSLPDTVPAVEERRSPIPRVRRSPRG
jgi:hypothetical protein